MPNLLKKIYFKTLAFMCNLSPFILEFIRKHDVKGKGQVIKYMKCNNEITADCGGITYRLNLKDDIQQHIYMNSYEKRNMSFFLELLKPGDIFFDAGANIGAYTLQAAKKLNSGSSIYAFEPEPGNYKRLDANCSLNEFSEGVNRYQIALSDRDGTAMLYISDETQSGWHSLNEFGDISIGKIEVTTVTLDSFIRKHGIIKVDLIKIDVEANEFELLEGTKKGLSEKLFKKIFIEFNGARLAEKNKNFNDFLNIFELYGYYPGKFNLSLLNMLKDRKIKQNTVCENFLFEPA